MLDTLDSYEKVKRAEKHINDLIVVLEEFASSQLYSVTIEECMWQHGWLRNDIVITINPDTPFRIEAALIIGDALHNLRSALDLLYYRIVTPGKDTKFTRFPIRDRREELEAFINGALKQKQITAHVATLILDTVKPYQTGNPPLWALKELNDRDKHKLLIPTFELTCIRGIHLRTEEQISLSYETIFTTQTCRKRLDDALYGRHPTVENKGKATTGIGFEFGIPHEGESVFPALRGIAEEVTRTIKAFQLLSRD
jgi:hypothetical protein